MIVKELFIWEWPREKSQLTKIIIQIRSCNQISDKVKAKQLKKKETEYNNCGNI